MADLDITLKRKVGAGYDNLYPTTSWTQVESKPTTFTPTSHTHGNVNNDGTITTNTAPSSGQHLVVTSSGNLIQQSSIEIGSNDGTFLRKDGSWAFPGGGERKFYNSISGTSGAWYDLFTISDGATGALFVSVQSYAHDDLLFTVGTGYGPSGLNNITILNCVSNPSGPYASISGVRVTDGGLVQAQFTWSSGPTVDIDIAVYGSGTLPTLSASLTANATSYTINDTVSLSGLSGKIRSENGFVSGTTDLGTAINGKLSLTGGSMTGTLTMSTAGIDLNNNNLANANLITIADPGPNEGIQWNGGNLWKIYESPNDLTTNSGGNLQVVQNATRRATFNTSGQLELPVATGTSPLAITSTTVNTNLNADLLDGNHASSFVLKSGDTMTGVLNINNQGDGDTGGYAQVFRSATDREYIFGGGGTQNTVTDYIRIGVNKLEYTYNSGTTNTIWHGGNDGASSGLDADLLDGNHASAFALSSHTHAISDVTNLQTTLDGKASTSHTHTISNISDVLRDYTTSPGADLQSTSYVDTGLSVDLAANGYYMIIMEGSWRRLSLTSVGYRQSVVFSSTGGSPIIRGHYTAQALRTSTTVLSQNISVATITSGTTDATIVTTAATTTVSAAPLTFIGYVYAGTSNVTLKFTESSSVALTGTDVVGFFGSVTAIKLN